MSAQAAPVKSYFRALLEGAALARDLARKTPDPAERRRHYERARRYLRNAKGWRQTDVAL